MSLISELTTEGFLAALKTFVPRRCLPSNVYSDNATSYEGANNILSKTIKEISQNCKSLYYLLEAHIHYTYIRISPKSPHIGGVWKSVVKSVKSQLKIILNNVSLNFEEFCTLLYKIYDYSFFYHLTQMAFKPLYLAISSLVRILRQYRKFCWRILLSITTEDLNIYNVWCKVCGPCGSQSTTILFKSATNGSSSQQETPLQGSLVLLKEDHTPTLYWHMGRIVEVYPGQDECVRIVTIRTHCTFQEGHLCFLPIYCDNTPD